eukprot:364545-Chlamydomonas_euryale.AAC.1
MIRCPPPLPLPHCGTACNTAQHLPVGAHAGHRRHAAGRTRDGAGGASRNVTVPANDGADRLGEKRSFLCAGLGGAELAYAGGGLHVEATE